MFLLRAVTPAQRQFRLLAAGCLGLIHLVAAPGLARGEPEVSADAAAQQKPAAPNPPQPQAPAQPAPADDIPAPSASTEDTGAPAVQAHPISQPEQDNLEPTPTSRPAATAQPAAKLPAPAPSVPEVLPTKAHIALYVDRQDAWLEIRDSLRPGPWRRVCTAPCNEIITVEGMKARVAGQWMTTSNAFRIEPGAGTARVKVSGGSRTARTLGIAGLVIGTPIAMSGLAMYGFGRMKDNHGLRTAGVAALAVGAVTTLASLPALAIGNTTVRDGRGKLIARRRSASAL